MAASRGADPAGRRARVARPHAAHRRRAARRTSSGAVGCSSPALTFSLMAGIFHAYYTVALAPAIGALVGMGGGEAWERRHGSSARSPWPRRRRSPPSGPSSCSRARRTGSRWLRSGCWSSAWRRPACSWSSCGCTAGGPLVVAGALVAGLAGPAAYTRRHRLDPAHRLHPHRRPVGRGGMGGPGGCRGLGRGGFGGAPGGPRRRHRHRAAPRPAERHRRQARRRRHGRPARREHPEHRGGRRARAPTPTLHLGRRGDRLAERRRATSSPPAAGHGRSAASTAATRPRRWRSSRRTSQAGEIHYFAASSGRRRPAAHGRQRRRQPRSPRWVAANFTAVTIGGSTFYDLTQPTSGGGRGHGDPVMSSHRRSSTSSSRSTTSRRRSRASVQRLRDHLQTRSPTRSASRSPTTPAPTAPGRWPAPGGELPGRRAVHLTRRAAAAHSSGLVALGRADPRLHGRRPVHRPRRPVAAGGAADVGALRPGDRHPAGARLPGRPRAPSAR